MAGHRLLYVASIALLVAVILAPIVLGFQPMITSTSYASVSKARYYGGTSAAIVLWVDNVRVSSLENPGNAELLEELAQRHRMVKPILAVDPDCPPSTCRVAWDTLRSLALAHGWEIAVRASLEELEQKTEIILEALGGYNIVTHALPSPVDVLEVGSTTPVELVPLPGLPKPLDPGGARLYYTVKAGQDSGWTRLLDAAVREAILIGGVVVVYTDPDSGGFSTLGEAMEAVAAEARAHNLWATTARDLYMYRAAVEGVRVDARLEDGYLTIDVEGSPQSVVTIIVDHPGVHEPPRKAGKALARLEALAPTPQEGYIEEGDRVIVNVRPPVRVSIPLGNPNTLLVPGDVVEAYRGVEGARLLALAVWAPLLLNMLLASSGLLAKRREAQEIHASYAVLIPARNSAGTIARVVLAALRQTIKPALVAVLDDDSSDGTSEAAERLASRLGLKRTSSLKLQNAEVVEYSGWTRLVIARFHQHTGKAGMINRILPLLPGDIEYVLVLDSDTIVERRYVEKLLAEMQSLGAEAGNGVLLLWRPDRDGRIAWAIAGALRNIGGLIIWVGLRSLEATRGIVGSLAGAAMLVSRRALERIGGLPEETLAEDAELTWRLGLNGVRTTVAPSALAWTMDPGSLYGVFRRALRIYQGLLVSMARLLPEALARGRLRLAAIILYTGLGGIPIALSLLHLAVTLSLIAVGMGEESLAYRLALAFPYTPLSIVLLPAVENPLLYLILVYIFIAIEAVLLLLVAVAFQRDARILRIAIPSLRYAPLFPIVLWVNALAMILALPGVLYRIVTRGLANKW
ncbi:MAG: glycosyltransferase family 2 protein [Desulfurococcales archaeon]|nr:glycosyltransferase family 2 protein [Desulfurococcales archaeon]